MSIGWGKRGLSFKDLDEFMDFKRRSSSHPDFIILHCSAIAITDQITGLQLAARTYATMLCSKIQNWSGPQRYKGDTGIALPG